MNPETVEPPVGAAQAANSSPDAPPTAAPPTAAPPTATLTAAIPPTPAATLPDAHRRSAA